MSSGEGVPATLGKAGRVRKCCQLSACWEVVQEVSPEDLLCVRGGDEDGHLNLSFLLISAPSQSGRGP